MKFGENSVNNFGALQCRDDSREYFFLSNFFESHFSTNFESLNKFKLSLSMNIDGKECKYRVFRYLGDNENRGMMFLVKFAFFKKAGKMGLRLEFLTNFNDST